MVWSQARKLTPLILLLVVVGGCGLQFRYNTTVYNSPEPALAEAQADVSAQVAGVTPASQRVPRSLEIVLPTSQAIADRGLNKQGTPAQASIDYLVQVMEIGMSGFVEAAKRRGFFEQVITSRSDGMTPPATFKGDHVLWYKLIDPYTVGWQIIDPSNGQMTALPPDGTVQNGTHRMMNYFERLEAEVLATGITPSAGSNSGSASGSGGSKHGLRGRKTPKSVRTVD